MFLSAALWLLLSAARAVAQCSAAPPQAFDTRPDITRLRVATYNTAFLVDGVADTAAAQSVWPNVSAATNHIAQVAASIRRLDADVICLQEVENCGTLALLNAQLAGMGYTGFLVPGTDTFTGQNVALLTRVSPTSNLQRSSARGSFPVANSTCTPVPASDTSVSKNFFTTLQIGGGQEVLLVCAHLKSGSDDSSCNQREGQGAVLRDIVTSQRGGRPVIVAGDWNDFSALVADQRGNVAQASVVAMAASATAPALTESEPRLALADRFTTATGMLDHILVSSDITVSAATVDHTDNIGSAAFRLSQGLSDHFALVLTVDTAVDTSLLPASSAHFAGTMWLAVLLPLCLHLIV